MATERAVPDNAARRVAELLSEQRQVGVAFDAAWDRALYSVLGTPRPRGQLGGTEAGRWQIALDFARPEFRAAYEGEPSRAAETVLRLAVALDEHEQPLTSVGG